MAAALIQFTQGAHTDAAGKAVLGAFGDFSAVTVTNGNNTGVVSWKIYLLDAPPDSSTFAVGSQPQILAQASNSTPTVNFVPDVAGTYRVMLEVSDGISTDRDIRCFGIPDARGFVRPPYQENVQPLPLALPGILTVDPRPIKPDEQNYATNVRGWAGNGSVGQLDQFLRQFDDLPQKVVTTTPYTQVDSHQPLHLVDLVTIGGPAVFNLPLSPRVGFVSRIGVLGPYGNSVTIQASGGGTVGSSTSLAVYGNSGVTLVHRGSNNWAILSGPVQPKHPDPVYVADYVSGLATTAGVIRSAFIAALAANLNSKVFIFPSGSWNWGPNFMNEAHGLRDNITLIGQRTELYYDVGGVAQAATIFMMLNYNFQPLTTVNRNVTVKGIKFTLLNALTSFFGLAFSVERASNCRIEDCEFVCTLAPAATSGKQRWGCGLFGDSTSPTNGGGRDNFFRGNILTNAQIQGCGAGRSVRNIQVLDTIVNQSNDLAISVVSTGAAQKVENVIIRGVTCYDNIGSGVILAGGDGNSAGEGIGEVRNYTIEDIHLAGARVDDLDFLFGFTIAFYGGIITENIRIRGVSSRLTGVTWQAQGIAVGGSPDQVSPSDWQGLEISDVEFGVYSDTDPLPQIYIDGNGIEKVFINNIKCKGPRGLLISNCDFMVINNVVTDNGQVQIQVNRNLSSIAVTNCSLTRTSNFLYALWFMTTSSNKSVASALVSNCYLQGHGQPGLAVTLNGGTAALQVSNCLNVGGTALDAETKAAIVKASNNAGMPLPTTITVTVPAVSAGNVGYATASTVGTRLAGITAATPILGHPTGELAATGAGGGALPPFISATNTIKIPFLGPVSSQSHDFSFWTP